MLSSLDKTERDRLVMMRGVYLVPPGNCNQLEDVAVKKSAFDFCFFFLFTLDLISLAGCYHQGC